MHRDAEKGILSSPFAGPGASGYTPGYACGQGVRRHGYIAADELGKPLRPHRYSAESARLCREAGEPVSRRHDARHSLNSLLAERGVPPHIRALQLGHTPEINQTTYTHASATGLTMVDGRDRRHLQRHVTGMCETGPEHNVIQAAGLRERGWIHFTLR